MEVLYINSPADVLASTKLGPTPNSTSAHLHCPGCYFNKTAKDAKKPFSFFKGSRSSIQKTCRWLRSRLAPRRAPHRTPRCAPRLVPHHAPRHVPCSPRHRWPQRTLEKTLKHLDKAWALPKTKRKAFMKAKGLRYSKTSLSVHASRTLAPSVAPSLTPRLLCRSTLPSTPSSFRSTTSSR